MTYMLLTLQITIRTLAQQLTTFLTVVLLPVCMFS